MTFKERILNIKTNFDYLYWGADIKILNLCRADKVKFIKKEIWISIISLYALIIFAESFTRKIAPLCLPSTLLVFVIYKWFLSNLNLALSPQKNGFLKWLIGTFIGILLGCLSIKAMRINMAGTDFEAISGIFIFCIVVIICYLPIRFKESKESLYAKMYAMQQEQERLRAEIIVNDNHQAEIEKHKKEIELQHQAHINYVSGITNKITIARLQLASQALKKWEDEQKLNIENGNNLEQFFSFKLDNKSKKSSSLTAAEQEVIDKGQTEYVTKLSKEIAEARLRLAMLAIAKWEEEQTKKIEDNVETYINA